MRVFNFDNIKESMIQTSKKEKFENNISACGVLFYKIVNGDIMLLLIKYDHKNWNLLDDFGGKIDNTDLTIHDAMRRETLEETNGIIDINYYINTERPNIFYNKHCQYYNVLIRVHESFYVDTTIFGDIETHDNIGRKIKWHVYDRDLIDKLSMRLNGNNELLQFLNNRNIQKVKVATIDEKNEFDNISNVRDIKSCNKLIIRDTNCVFKNGVYVYDFANVKLSPTIHIIPKNVKIMYSPNKSDHIINMDVILHTERITILSHLQRNELNKKIRNVMFHFETLRFIFAFTNQNMDVINISSFEIKCDIVKMNINPQYILKHNNFGTGEFMIHGGDFLRSNTQVNNSTCKLIVQYFNTYYIGLSKNFKNGIIGKIANVYLTHTQYEPLLLFSIIIDENCRGRYVYDEYVPFIIINTNRITSDMKIVLKIDNILMNVDNFKYNIVLKIEMI